MPTDESLNLQQLKDLKEVARQLGATSMNVAEADAAITNNQVGGLPILTDLALKAPIANPTFTGTVEGITNAMVGLGNVENTADTDKPVSNATQTALDAITTDLVLKANAAELVTISEAVALNATKVGFTDALVAANSAVAANTAKVVQLELSQGGLYEMGTSFALYSASSVGRYGPTRSSQKALNAEAWKKDDAFLNVGTGLLLGFQIWTVPKSGEYQLSARGAKGGNNGRVGDDVKIGGQPAETYGRTWLNKGTKLAIVVGQPGEDGGTIGYAASVDDGCGGGGGGASWIMKVQAGEALVLLAVAGGGGGASNLTAGQNAYASQGISTAQPSRSRTWNVGSGGGWTLDGEDASTGGKSVQNGAIGGLPSHFEYPAHGGFGGGGGAGVFEGGGGGGYMGGATAKYNTPYGGGGGTSRNNMRLPTFISYTGNNSAVVTVSQL